MLTMAFANVIVNEGNGGNMGLTLSSIQKGQIIEPPRILIHGVEGIGKTAFAAAAPRPIFIATEKGRGALDLHSFPVAKTWQDVTDAIDALLREAHEYETVVIDSTDWLEKIVHGEICTAKRQESIEDFGWGKGYAKANAYWEDLLSGLDMLHEKKHMAVILISHSVIKTFKNPEGDDYDQYILSMHKDAAATLKEWADTVVFANYDVKVLKAEGSPPGEKGKAVKTYKEPERLLFTQERPAYWAKNRYNLPHTLPLSWPAFEKAMDAGIAKTAKQSSN
jgi:hypothetical protein